MSASVTEKSLVSNSSEKSHSKKVLSISDAKSLHLNPEIFEASELMDGLMPVFLSEPTQKIFEISENAAAKSKGYIKIERQKILDDMHERAAVSDFSVIKPIINNMQDEEIMLLYDDDFKFGENFVILTDSNVLNKVLVYDQTSERDDKTSEKRSIDYCAPDELDMIHEIVCTPGKWKDLGSEAEMRNKQFKFHRESLMAICSRARKHFNAPITLKDVDSKTNDLCVSIIAGDDTAETIITKEVDKSCTNINSTSEISVNTNLINPRNAITQYYSPSLYEDEAKDYLDNLENFHVAVNCMEEGIRQNNFFEFYVNDYSNLNTTGEVFAVGADSIFKEYVSLSDLKYAREKTVTAVKKHPKYKSIIAMSLGERLSYDDRMDSIHRILVSPSYIMLWCFLDPIQPQLLLESRDDIITFEFNPSTPEIVAAGLFNGQIVLWDISKYDNDLKNVKAKLKEKNKKAVFSFHGSEKNAMRIAPVCCYSHLDQSHMNPVMDLQWVPDHLDITKTGMAYENKELKSYQIITVGLDAQILFWETRPNISPIVMEHHKEKVPLPKNTPETFIDIDEKWKPFLKIYLTKPDSTDPLPVTKCTMAEQQGERQIIYEKRFSESNQPGQGNQPANTGTGQTTGQQGTQKNRTFPNLDTVLFVGTEDGQMVAVDWMPTKQSTQDNQKEKGEGAKLNFIGGSMIGPILYCRRNPLCPKIILLVGGFHWSLWKDNCLSGPLIHSNLSKKLFTGAQWSPDRPAVFYLTRIDGSIEAWDLLDKTHEPALVSTLATSCLTALDFLKYQGKNLVAVGDLYGSLHVYIVPRKLHASPMPNEAESLVKYIDREVDRQKYCNDRADSRESERIEVENQAKIKAGLAAAPGLSEEEKLTKLRNLYNAFLEEEMRFRRQLGLEEVKDDDL